MHFSYTNHVVVQNVYIYISRTGGKGEHDGTDLGSYRKKKTVFTQVEIGRSFHEVTHVQILWMDHENAGFLPCTLVYTRLLNGLMKLCSRCKQTFLQKTVRYIKGNKHEGRWIWSGDDDDDDGETVGVIWQCASGSGHKFSPCPWSSFCHM